MLSKGIDVMKVFNKIIACLIVASFIFSSEGFAAKPKNNNEEKRSITVKPRLKRAPKKERENVRRSRRKASTKNRLETAKSRRSVRGKRSITPRPAAERKRPAKTRALRTTRPAAERKRPSKTKAPRNYTIRGSDVPEDLKKDLMLAFNLDEVSFNQAFNSKATPNDLRVLLTKLQSEEDSTRGFTQKIRNMYVSQGYQPGSAGSFTITTAMLTEDQKELLKTGLRTNHLEPSYSLLHSSASSNLNTIQQLENRTVGLSQRARNFLKTKYGFEG